MKVLLLSLLFISSIFANNFESDAQLLIHSNSKEKPHIINNLYDKYSNNSHLVTLFDAISKRKLYYNKSTNNLVYLLHKNEKKYYLEGLTSSVRFYAVSKNDYKQVKSDYDLRSLVRQKLSEMNLFSRDRNIRLAAAKDIKRHLYSNSLAVVKKALENEKDPHIRSILNECKLIEAVRFSHGDEQKAAIVALGDSVSLLSLGALEGIKNGQNKILIPLAKKSIAHIKANRSFYSTIQRAFFGLSLGSILLLAALGLSITFGVLKVINMAHGGLIMIGAYTTFTIQQLMPNLIDFSLLVAIPVAFLVSALIGILIEYLVIRHLYNRPLETLLATFGISLVLQQLVRTIYSPINQAVATPQWMTGALKINSALSLTYSRLYIIIFSIIVFISVLLLLKKTSLGVKVRAVTQNRKMAQAMGINTRFIDAITFGLGSGIAGIAGVALSQVTNVGPNLGQEYLVNSFMVVVFGGVGNLWGTFIAAITMGEFNKFLEPTAGAIMTKVLILVFIILFIQKKPRGLFPQRGRDAED